MIRFLFIPLLVFLLIAPFAFFINKVAGSPVDGNFQSEKIANTKATKGSIAEKSFHHVKLPNFSAIRDVKTKKKLFFDFIRPAVILENNKLLANRAELKRMLKQGVSGAPLTNKDILLLSVLTKKYKVNKSSPALKQINELLIRVDIVPSSLVMVQAANESAWGTSRFARKGLNFFGIWCYRKGCGMIPSGRRMGSKHEVAAFKSVNEAVARYLYNINTNNEYKMFRTIRAKLRVRNQHLNAKILAEGLLPYSERGAAYVSDITNMLRHNKAYLTDKDE